MEFDPSKNKTTAPTNVILGVEVHLQDFLRECKVSFSPTKKRCEEILHQLSECERRGIITIMEAAQTIAKCMGHTDPVWITTPGKAGSTPNRRPDIGKLKSILKDYRPRTFEQGVQEIIDKK
jgi:hypothetical protein